MKKWKREEEEKEWLYEDHCVGWTPKDYITTYHRLTYDERQPPLLVGSSSPPLGSPHYYSHHPAYSYCGPSPTKPKEKEREKVLVVRKGTVEELVLRCVICDRLIKSKEDLGRFLYSNEHELDEERGICSDCWKEA